MPRISRQASVRQIVQGHDRVLSLAILDNDHASLVPTSGSFTLRQGATIIAGPTAITVAATNTVTVTAAESNAGTLGGDLLEWWDFTISGETGHVFRRSAFLVRHELFQSVSDTDLTNRHEDLTRIRPSGLSSFQPYLDAAWERILRDLSRMHGQRPELIMDQWALFDLELQGSLEFIFRDFETQFGEGRYASLKDEYKEMYKQSWKDLGFRYDDDEDGVIDTLDQRWGQADQHRKAEGWPWMWSGDQEPPNLE